MKMALSTSSSFLYVFLGGNVLSLEPNTSEPVEPKVAVMSRKCFASGSFGIICYKEWDLLGCWNKTKGTKNIKEALKLKEITNLLLPLGSQIDAFWLWGKWHHVTDLSPIPHHMGIRKARIKLVSCYPPVDTTIKSLGQFPNTISPAASKWWSTWKDQ